MNNLLIPVTTPFISDPSSSSFGELDHNALRNNFRRWNETDIAGYVILGSTGERVHLDEREYLEVIELARNSVPSNLRFIVGAGQQSTRGTIDEIKRATTAGADAVLVITPNFYRTAITQEVLVSYYSAVADASSVPLLLYSMPGLTGIKIDPVTIARLSEHPNIIGVKDSSSDISGFAQTIKLCGSDFTVMTGNGTVFLDALKAGATGAVLAVACAVPEICLEIYSAFTCGQVDLATAIQSKLTPFAHAVTLKYGISGLKSALDMCGYSGGVVRTPLSPITDDAKQEISTLLKDLKSVLPSIPTPSR